MRGVSLDQNLIAIINIHNQTLLHLCCYCPARNIPWRCCTHMNWLVHSLLEAALGQRKKQLASCLTRIKRYLLFFGVSGMIRGEIMPSSWPLIVNLFLRVLSPSLHQRVHSRPRKTWISKFGDVEANQPATWRNSEYSLKVVEKKKTLKIFLACMLSYNIVEVNNFKIVRYELDQVTLCQINITTRSC